MVFIFKNILHSTRKMLLRSQFTVKIIDLRYFCIHFLFRAWRIRKCDENNPAGKEAPKGGKFKLCRKQHVLVDECGWAKVCVGMGVCVDVCVGVGVGVWVITGTNFMGISI